MFIRVNKKLGEGKTKVVILNTKEIKFVEEFPTYGAGNYTVINKGLSSEVEVMETLEDIAHLVKCKMALTIGV
jgi:hypothetical protein